MTFRQLLARSLVYYWRTNLAVALGVIAATAVITGALLVGDSVRDSLIAMSQARLGKIDAAILGGRFFRQALAEDLQQSLQASNPTQKSNFAAAPVLMLQGTVQTQASTQQTQRPPENSDQHDATHAAVTRAGQINVYGLTADAWNLLEHADLLLPQSGEVVLNERVASQLGVTTGDSLSLIVEIPSAIPRDALLGERNETMTELSLKVSGVAPDKLGLARLGMNPTQQLPANVYVPLEDLQVAMGLQAVGRSRSNPLARPARINTLFIAAPDQSDTQGALTLTAKVKQKLALADLGLRLVENQEHGYLSLESEQMYLESTISSTAQQSAEHLGVQTSPVMVYLANEIWNGAAPEHYSMYSVVAGIDPVETPPFGPFQFVGEHLPLTDDSVYLNEWVAQDLKVHPGDSVKLKYHVVGDRGELPEGEASFTVAGIVALQGPANDRGYTPDVPGVTDAQSYADWREPFPLKRDRITDRDDDYWTDYRTTPKVFLTLKKSQMLWKSRYGMLTTLRMAPRDGQTLPALKTEFETAFLEQVNLSALGLNVQPVREVGLKAAQGTTDFTGLFIGFSFFLILSAAMLIGLLFRLAIEQRVRELGLLSAIGLTPRAIRRLLFIEGGVLVGLGALIGLAAAIGYAALMIHGLKTWWYGAIGTRFLDLSVHPLTLLIGFVIAVGVAAIAIWWGQWQTTRSSTRQQLSGALSETGRLKPARVSAALSVLGLGGSLTLLVLTLTGMIPDVEAFGGFSWRVVMFFLIGIGLLMGSLASFSLAMNASQTLSLTNARTGGEARLGFKNAGRNRSRSVLTSSLIASATFVIVAVAAGQMNPVGETPRNRSGNGGFMLVAQSSVPILYDLNTENGRVKLGLNPQNSQQMTLLNHAKVFPFRMRPGENASCLNLYQTQLPTVLGVPDDVLDNFTAEQRFVFADTRAEHPWELLREHLPDGRIPVLGDMNTLMYSLHKGIGARINVPDDDDPQHTLQVEGMFANSIFQGVLVMSEQNFLKVFPEEAGFRYFLIDVDSQHAQPVSRLLETELGDYGFDVDRVSDRLANFLSVQNTYLSTFQTLGGLGLLLGTLGLATVMLRNVLERAGEFALLRAVGFRNGQVARIVAWENALLLGGGLLCGAASALLAMSPHLLSAVADVPWGSLAMMLGSVFALGMLASLAAVGAAVKLPLLSTLRGE